MWFDCTKVALKMLKIVYNNSLRRFVFLPWRNSATEMFVNLRIHSFDEMLRIFVFSFRSRVTASHNQLIFGLCSAHCSVYSKLWAWWNSLLLICMLSLLLICTYMNVIIYLMHLPHLILFHLLCIYFT